MGLRQFYLGDLSNKEKALMFLPEELPIGSVAICRLGGTPQNQPHFYSSNLETQTVSITTKTPHFFDI